MKFFTNDMIKKEENGAITLFVLMACLFFVFILSGVYISNLNKMQMQEQQLEQIKDNYARTITNFEEQAGPKPKEIYSESGLEEEAENNIDLFEYEIISNEEIEDTTFAQSLPKKTARITKIKDMYCNSVDGGIYNPEVGAKVNTYYQIKNYKGKDISDTLVIPYQAKINGEMYRITEVNLYLYGYDNYYEGEEIPDVQTIIYPNTVSKIKGTTRPYTTNRTKLNKVVLSENLLEIEKNTFQSCRYLTNVKIPNNVKSIGEEAFEGCLKLTSIVIPNSVTSIGDSAFSGCFKLASVVIPDSVTKIGKSVFYGCSKLTSVTIPNSVTSISDYAFGGCTNLKTVNFRGTQEEWSKITIGTNNTALSNAKINYNYTEK